MLMATEMALGGSKGKQRWLLLGIRNSYGQRQQALGIAVTIFFEPLVKKYQSIAEKGKRCSKNFMKYL
jgi:hypothetical protein